MGAGELVIVGAGPAGLALSMTYAGKSRLLELSQEVGGLCRSVEFGGGVFDIGGHSFHSPYPEVTALVHNLMKGRWHSQRRDARVFFDGRLIDYPFQEHLHQINDPAILGECQAGEPGLRVGHAADNFEDWIVARFGSGVARHFMLPYNRKLWARDLRRISCEWVGERIAGSGANGAARSADTAPRRQPLEAQSCVAYPADGGFVEVFRAMAGQSGPIEFGQEVRHIDTGAKTVQCAGGGVWSWDRLVSTMPLPALLRAISDCPKELIAEADRLEYVSLKVLLILIGKGVTDQPQRVYVADPHVPAHKIAFNHTSSPSLRERPVHAIMCEIAYSPEKPVASDAELAATMLDWMAGARLIDSPVDAIETRIADVQYGYPVPTHDRSAIVERIRTYLARFGIFTIGRFGGWEYINSDACIWQGVRLATELGTSR